MKTDHVQIRIDSPTKDIWKAAAARNRLTLSAYIERAVDSVAGGPAFLRPDEINALDQVREQLRRTQEAAAEARRRAVEAQRRREEEAYLAQFGQVPDQSDAGTTLDQGGNVPGAVIPEPVEEPIQDTGYSEPLLPSESDAANAPTAETESPTDLSDIREELRRRNED